MVFEAVGTDLLELPLLKTLLNLLTYFPRLFLLSALSSVGVCGAGELIVAGCIFEFRDIGSYPYTDPSSLTKKIDSFAANSIPRKTRQLCAGRSWRVKVQRGESWRWRAVGCRD